jgi:hypothetical protein
MTTVEKTIHAYVFRVLGLFLLSCDLASAKDFADWTVGCDNTRSCSAFGFPAEGQEPNGFIRIERAGGPQSPVEVSITIFVDGAIGTAPLSLKIDGKAIQGVASERTGSSGQTGRDGFTTRLSSGELEAFVAALRKGMTLGLVVARDKVQGKVEISLRGAVAALLNIDDIQGRIWTKTALVRRGNNRFAGTVPPEPEIGSVKPLSTTEAKEGLAPKLRATLKNFLAEHCDNIGVDSGFTDEVFALDANRALVGLICSTGAYNITSNFWIVNSDDLANAMPVKFDTPGRTPDNSLVNAGFDKGTGVIEFFRKDRGLGDCGATGKYVWTGSKFALASYATMGACRGVPSQDWPILWRAKVL